MATLTESAYYSRRIIKWSIFGLVMLVVFRLLFFAALDAIREAFPRPTLEANNAFGKLPKISFPKTASPSAQLIFTLQTVTGTVPEFDEVAKVYFMPKNRSGFLSLSNAQKKVDNIDFTTTPRQTSATNYRWIDLDNPLRSIEMDTVNEHFLLSYAYIHDLSLFSSRQVPSENQAIDEALALLKKLSSTPSDLDKNNSFIQYLKLIEDKLEPTTSQSQADAIQVELFRQNHDGYKVVTDKPNQGNVSFILSGSRTNSQRILKADYRYWPLDTRTFGVYNLKTSQEAWTELQRGLAYYASLPENTTEISITDVYLAYYDSKEAQFFMQPVYVFQGDPDFTAYIQAIAPPYTE